MSRDNFVLALEDAREASKSPTVQAERFVEQFYVGADSEAPWFFVFRENLGVTNLQYAELLALLQVHCRPVGPARTTGSLEFVSFIALQGSLQGLFTSLRDVVDEKAESEFIDAYSHLLHNMVVIDRLYSSCAVYAPPGLTFDHQRICAEAGYVHSCGRHIYTQSVQTADPKAITTAVGEYLARLKRDRAGTDDAGRRVFLAAFSHEDTPDEDAVTTDASLRGLRVSVLRTHCGTRDVAHLLKSLKDRLRENLVVAAPGDYKAEREKFCKDPEADLTRTIWVMKDSGSVNPPDGRFSPSYLVCYAQEWINANPVYLLDEEKPAWVAQNTFPHTLAAALTNMTRPYWSGRGGPGLEEARQCADGTTTIICDPFVGSGTVWLENLKLAGLGPALEVRCSDDSYLASLMARDNLDFLMKSADTVRRYADRLKEAENLLKKADLAAAAVEESRIITLEVDGDAASLGGDELLPRAWALLRRTVGSLPGEGGGIPELQPSKAHAEELRRHPFEVRLMFYVAVRALVRHRAWLRRLIEFDINARDAWLRGCLEESRALHRRLSELVDRLEIAEQRLAEAPIDGILWSYQDVYSRAVSVDYAAAARSALGNVESAVSQGDAKGLAKRSVDVVITDPPYDFNEPEPHLPELIHGSLRAILGAIRDEGQVILCLPEFYANRRQPVFAHRSLIVPQLRIAAEEQGLEVTLMGPAYPIPPPPESGGAPFYWRATQLHRAILHARVRRKGQQKDSGAAGNAEAAP